MHQQGAVMASFKLGIDLGGTKTEAVLLDNTGAIRFQQRMPTPAQDYTAILETIRGLVDQAESVAGEQLAVGVGTPGAISPKTGRLRNSNTVVLIDRDVQGDLQQVLDRPVRIANDANCFALSEAMDGAAADAEMVFGVIIGTGTGGGVVWRKQLISGPHGIAGEWGHNPMPWLQTFDSLRRCYCGKTGCIETFLSGPGLSANVEALTGLRLTSHEIVSRAEAGDALCLEQMDHYHDQMARALAHVINILDPDAIVLGGGMSNIQSLYDEVPKRLPEYVFSDVVSTRLLRPMFGDSSGVRGAAWLWE